MGGRGGGGWLGGWGGFDCKWCVEIRMMGV